MEAHPDVAWMYSHDVADMRPAVGVRQAVVTNSFRVMGIRDLAPGAPSGAYREAHWN